MFILLKSRAKSHEAFPFFWARRSGPEVYITGRHLLPFGHRVQLSYELFDIGGT